MFADCIYGCCATNHWHALTGCKKYLSITTNVYVNCYVNVYVNCLFANAQIQTLSCHCSRIQDVKLSKSEDVMRREKSTKSSLNQQQLTTAFSGEFSILQRKRCWTTCCAITVGRLCVRSVFLEKPAPQHRRKKLTTLTQGQYIMQWCTSCKSKVNKLITTLKKDKEKPWTILVPVHKSM